MADETIGVDENELVLKLGNTLDRDFLILMCISAPASLFFIYGGHVTAGITMAFVFAWAGFFYIDANRPPQHWLAISGLAFLQYPLYRVDPDPVLFQGYIVLTLALFFSTLSALYYMRVRGIKQNMQTEDS